jgi:manganese/zinc/iron transport system substrate-binding protein
MICLLVGCDGSSSDSTTNNSPARWRAVATTGPVGDALRRLGGERIEVAVLMGPGIDPHLYKEKPSDLRRLEQADLIVYNGLHLEGRLADVLERLGEKKRSIALAGALEASHDERLISPKAYSTLHDPHVWHDVALWSDCVQHLCNELCEFDPEGAEVYRKRNSAFRMELAALDKECRLRLDAVPAELRVLVTAHDAFAYFSRAYGLESVGLKGISTEDEVDLGRMTDVVALLVERKIPALFVESAVAPKIVEALIEPCAVEGHTVRIGGELYADALGPVGSGADDYLGMIRANVTTIVESLTSAQPATEATP